MSKDKNNNDDNKNNVTPIRPTKQQDSVENIMSTALEAATEASEPSVDIWQINMKSGEQYVLDGLLSIYGDIYVLSDGHQKPIFSSHSTLVDHVLRLDSYLVPNDQSIG